VSEGWRPYAQRRPHLIMSGLDSAGMPVYPLPRDKHNALPVPTSWVSHSQQALPFCEQLGATRRGTCRLLNPGGYDGAKYLASTSWLGGPCRWQVRHPDMRLPHAGESFAEVNAAHRQRAPKRNGESSH
jgi:hypothetical protein